ncbi:MAG: glycosyltransferase family 2 protein [Acidobacteria bacterium]|nr:glycosyltransferase family 2 protein [Acidobacteriota bacterium]
MPISSTAVYQFAPRGTKLFPHSLSVFFPAYNDAPSIGKLVENTFEILSGCVEEFEVIVVNDGSRDGTAAVLNDLKFRFGDRLRVITHAENRGYGGALRSGFQAARHEFVFYTDGDGQYDVAELPRLLRRVTSTVGLVNGYKARRQDPWHRIVIGILYNRFARWLFRVRLRDIDCDYRLIRRSALRQHQLTSSSGTICIELVKAMEASGMEVVELPVGHYARAHGSSQFFRIRSLARTFTEITSLYYRSVVAPWLMPRGKQVSK